MKTGHERTGPGQRFSGEPVSVVTACDEGYLPYLAVFATSLASNRAPATEVELTILQPGIGEWARDRLAEHTRGITLNWVDVDESAYRAVGFPNEPMVQRPHYFRCLIGTMLPPNLRRCIYMDGDTLVHGDLGDLWTTDLGDSVVGAALDYFVPRTGDAIAPWRDLELDPEALYFNSGVMLINLDAWRAEDIGTRVLWTCCRYRDYLMAQGKWPQHDQFGLNAILQNRWHRLSQDWNYLSEMPFHEPRVVHYCGGGKPMSRTCQPEFAAWFYDTLAQTAWWDRRP